MGLSVEIPDEGGALEHESAKANTSTTEPSLSSGESGDPNNAARWRRPIKSVGFSGWHLRFYFLAACGVAGLVGLVWQYSSQLKAAADRQDSDQFERDQCSNHYAPATATVTEVEACCNGLENNCRLRVNEMMWATVHNAMSSVEDGFVAANNRRQLEVRTLKGPSYIASSGAC